MDLQTLRQNLQAAKYKTFKAFFNDVQLIWSNCKQYNQQGSQIYILAEKLERKSKKLIKQLIEQIFNSKGANNSNSAVANRVPDSTLMYSKQKSVGFPQPTNQFNTSLNKISGLSMLSSPEKAETYSEIFKIDNTKFKAQQN